MGIDLLEMRGERMREKLIELITQADSKCFNRECENCEYKGLSNCDSILIADYLIENGVVIPVRCSVCEYMHIIPLTLGGKCGQTGRVVCYDDYCSHGKTKEKGEE